MPRKKKPVPKVELIELEWWDKEVEGIQLRFVIKRVTREDRQRWQRRISYPVSVRRTDYEYYTVHDAFDDLPTRGQVEQRFSARNLKSLFAHSAETG